MTNYFESRAKAVLFANEQLFSFAPGSVSTMIIRRARSGDYSVSIVTDESLEDTELQTAKFFSETQVNT